MHSNSTIIIFIIKAEWNSAALCVNAILIIIHSKHFARFAADKRAAIKQTALNADARVRDLIAYLFH